MSFSEYFAAGVEAVFRVGVAVAVDAEPGAADEAVETGGGVET